MVTRTSNGAVEFAFYRPAAQTVSLAGDFNGWSKQATMTRDEAGWWRSKVMLPPGEYRFKYLVDGSIWEADFAAYGVTMDKNRTWTSTLWVPPTQVSTPVQSAPLRRAA